MDGSRNGARGHAVTDADQAMLLSRRKLLLRAGVGAGLLASAPLLAACGDDGATGATSAGAGGEVGGELNLYTWEGYDAAKATAAWKRRNDVQVKANFVGVQGDVETRIKSPAGEGIDISTVNQSYITYYQDLGILTPISEEEVPALANLLPQFREAPYRNEDGTFNVVPYCFGYNGLVYAPDAMDAPDSWDVLLDPSLAGRVAVWDDPYFGLQLAALILGFNPDELTHDQLDEIKAWLAELAPQVKVFTPSIGDFITILASGDVDAVYNAWNGTPVFIEGRQAEIAIPDEGALGWIDCNFIPPAADNRATAAAWCQVTLEGKGAAAAYDAVAGGTPNPEVVPLLKPETRALYPYDDLNALFDQLGLPNGFPRGDSEFVTADEAVAAWNEFKASAS